MTDKTSNQIEALLEGKRFKLLDPTRKGVLALPNAAFKLWMAFWMFESDAQEAYPSMETLVAATDMAEGTIRTAREYLLETGWLVKLTGSAAEKVLKPSNGSWNVSIYRVDDPQNMTPRNLTGQNMTLAKVDPNVTTAFALAVASTGTTGVATTCTCTCGSSSPSESTALRGDEKQKPETKTTTRATRSTSATQWLQKYGEEKPAWFDEAAHTAGGQLRRSAWIEEHKRKVLPVETIQEAPASVETKVKPTPLVQPPNSAPPPTAKTPEPVKSAPVEIDLKVSEAKKLAQNMYKLQMHYNAKVQPPADWATAWVAESAELVELAGGDDPYFPRWYMLDDVIVLSQVKYATKYTRPALIAEHIPELAEEVLALRIRNEFDAMWDMYLKALGRLVKNDAELDAESLERKARDKQKDAEISLKVWKGWMAKHRQLSQPESGVA